MKMTEQKTRIDREFDTRELNERPKVWQPASALPEPKREAGYEYRWIRISSMGKADATNVSKKTREGWEPVRIEEQPEFEMFRETGNDRFKDNIEVGGLLLCKIPSEMIGQRNAHYANRNRSQMESVDNNFMRQNDARMPLFQEKRSTTSFGKGK
jgi:hypothetical protein